MAVDVGVPNAPMFADLFELLTGNPPYPWQEKLFQRFLSGSYPSDINLPTGSGKTAIMAIWLAALAQQAAERGAGSTIPRRLVWIVDRRVVVDQATDEAAEMSDRLRDSSNPGVQWLVSSLRTISGNQRQPLAISTLRGEREDNREWSRDPAQPAIIVGTVDMIGSRLLFSGYGDGSYGRAQHAGLLGHDALLINDESHLTPALAGLLRGLETKQAHKIKPFSTIRLSATHSATECWPESLEDDRSDARFRKSFESSKGLRIQVHQAGKLEPSLLELAMEPGPARTLIFVREPEKAKKFADALVKRSGTADRVLTLTGTMRGFERDRIVGSEAFKAFAARTLPTESWWLVATSAGEVGVNISSDRLITDLDTLDHLLQRFGRLNRFGETDGLAHLLLSETEEKSGEKDQRKKRSWAALQFLRGLPLRPDGAHDISPVALFGLNLPHDALSEHPLEAPLHNWHIDVWSQTSLGSHPARPKVEPWLHGKQENTPETYVAWRKDVAHLASESVDSSDRGEVLQKYRLLAHEQLREPTAKLFEKLQVLAATGDGRTKLLRRKMDGSVDAPKLNEIVGSKSTEIAYCQLVLRPGCGRLENGMFSPVWAEDTTNSASPHSDNSPTHYDVSGVRVTRERGELESLERGASFKAVQLQDGTWSLSRISGIPGREYTPEILPDLRLTSLRRFATEHQWRFLLKVPLEPAENEPDLQPSSLLYFARARDQKPVGEVCPLDKHSSDVARAAQNLASRLGLREDLALALKVAGELHDLGKEEPIWQKAAGNLNSDRTYREKVPIAKSVKPMRGRDLNGFRHELASIRHVEQEIPRRELSLEARDLVLHLIAAHHGNARPHFESKAYDRHHWMDSERIALDTARRFAGLQERYGAWGLAYLESILRSADRIASEEWEDPSYA